MVRTFKGILPKIAETAYIDASAQIIGDVVIGEHSSVWPNAVVRGDVYYIRIGAQTNIQDNCVLHVETDQYQLLVGDRVTVGHNAVLHGCRIASDCLIGVGAVILNDAEIGAGSIIAAGALVPEHMVVPPGSLCMGVPATVRRQVTEGEVKRIHRGADRYLGLKDIYLTERLSAVQGLARE
jgi:gamma-carbonic anhydrase